MQTHQSIHLFSKLPICIQTYQFIYFQNYQSTSRPINLSIFKTTNIQAHLSVDLLSKLPITCKPINSSISKLPIDMKTYQFIYFQNFQYTSTPISWFIFKTTNSHANLLLHLFSKLPIYMQTYQFIYFQNYQSASRPINSSIFKTSNVQCTCIPINSSIFKSTNLQADLSIHLFLFLKPPVYQ